MTSRNYKCISCGEVFSDSDWESLEDEKGCLYIEYAACGEKLVPNYNFEFRKNMRAQYLILFGITCLIYLSSLYLPFMEYGVYISVFIMAIMGVYDDILRVPAAAKIIKTKKYEKA